MVKKNKGSKVKSDNNKISTFERVEQEYEELKKRVKYSEKTKNNQRSGFGRDSGSTT